MGRQVLIATAILVLSFGSLMAQVNIMPLGNSITQADSGHNSYRYFLDQLFNQATFSFDFVGSHDTNYLGYPAQSNFDKDNEGHWGWRADEILNGRPGQGKLSEWIKTYSVDAALIHIGTNDIFQNQGVNSTLAELKQIIDTLRHEHPTVVIFLAKLIPTSINPVRNANLTMFNDSLPNLALQMANTNSPIIVVDQNSGFNAVMGQDTYDTVHPNDSGAIKMATKWFQSVTAYYVPLAISNLNLEIEVHHQVLNVNWEYFGSEEILSLDLEQKFVNNENWESVKSQAVDQSFNGVIKIDPKFNQSVFLRLIGLRKDGSRIVSNTEMYLSNKTDLEINYIHGRSEVHINSTSNFSGLISLVDATGKKILEERLSIRKGVSQYDIGSTQLATGIYWVHIVGPNGSWAKNLFISHEK